MATDAVQPACPIPDPFVKVVCLVIVFGYASLPVKIDVSGFFAAVTASCLDTAFEYFEGFAPLSVQCQYDTVFPQAPGVFHVRSAFVPFHSFFSVLRQTVYPFVIAPGQGLDCADVAFSGFVRYLVCVDAVGVVRETVCPVVSV